MVDTEHFRKKLLAMKGELSDAITQAGDSAKPVELDQTSVGRVSRIDAIQQQEMSLAAQRRRAEMIVRIDMALRRIDEGEYGYCRQCDEEIPEKRLEIDPTCLTCVNCA